MEPFEYKISGEIGNEAPNDYMLRISSSTASLQDALSGEALTFQKLPRMFLVQVDRSEEVGGGRVLLRVPFELTLIEGKTKKERGYQFVGALVQPNEYSSYFASLVAIHPSLESPNLWMKHQPGYSDAEKVELKMPEDLERWIAPYAHLLLFESVETCGEPFKSPLLDLVGAGGHFVRSSPVRKYAEMVPAIPKVRYVIIGPSREAYESTHRELQVCRFFSDSFPGAACWGEVDRASTKEKCLNFLRSVRRQMYTIYAVYELWNTALGEQVIGYANIKPSQINSNTLLFMLTNVCIDPKWRRRGVATQMLQPGTIGRVVRMALRSIDMTPRKRDQDSPRIIIGASVDWKDEHASEAFSLFARLGFIRWMHSCKEEASEEFLSRKGDNPLDVLNSAGKGIRSLMTTREDSQSSTPELAEKFCMYKLWEDNWKTVGTRLQSYYRTMQAIYYNRP